MCDKQRRCTTGVPKSIQAHDDIKGSLESMFVFGENDLPVSIPGIKDDYTKSIIAVDINGDSFVDIVVGNWQNPIEILLNNEDGTFSEPIHPPDSKPPGSNIFTTALSAADLNNDQFVDIIVGFNGHPNQVLMNKDNNLFEIKDLPTVFGGANTKSIFVADVNNDGWLDIVVGNH